MNDGRSRVDKAPGSEEETPGVVELEERLEAVRRAKQRVSGWFCWGKWIASEQAQGGKKSSMFVQPALLRPMSSLVVLKLSGRRCWVRYLCYA